MRELQDQGQQPTSDASRAAANALSELHTQRAEEAATREISNVNDFLSMESKVNEEQA